VIVCTEPEDVLGGVDLMLLHEPDADGGGLAAEQFEVRLDLDWMWEAVQGLARPSFSVAADLRAFQSITVDYNRNTDRLSVL
jgi:hypothetical protein